jgi:IS4 transposase
MQISIQAELSNMELPDKRLNRRARLIAEGMERRIDESLPANCPDWCEVVGAYRFFGNERVDAGKLLEPHMERTVERSSGCAAVRCVEDTTIFDFGRHPETEGLGPINKDYQNGFLCHTMMAYDSLGRCLGLLGQESWVRTDGLGKRAEAKTKLIEEKESFRWLRGYRRVEELAARHPDRRWIYVADREADIYDLLYEHKNADYVIRSRFDRRTDEGRKMLEQVGECESLGQWKIDAPAGSARADKRITVSVKAKQLRLVAPWKPSRKERKKLFPSPCRASVVLVEEVDPPAGEEPVRWVLLTSLPAESFEQAREIVGHYCCRWQIEIFFRTLKSGCRYESLQLKSFAKLQRALSLYSLVAWRIVALVQLAKARPQACCEQAMLAEEWRAIHLLHGETPPSDPPPLGQTFVLLARLGGYLNRKKDPPPGPEVIWRALKQIAPVALLLKKQMIKCV